MTEVFKVVLMVVDYDKIGKESIKEEIEEARYGNRCITPDVMSIVGVEAGDVAADDHPLNRIDTAEAEFKRLFPETLQTLSPPKPLT